jgi:hypothetical protein
MRIAHAQYLYLLPIAGSDVGYGPAGLLPDALLGRGQQGQQAGQGTTVDNHLYKHIIVNYLL